MPIAYYTYKLQTKTVFAMSSSQIYLVMWTRFFWRTEPRQFFVLDALQDQNLAFENY